MESEPILITGYAKLPQGVAVSEMYPAIALGLVVDPETGEILDVDCSLATQIARDFVKQLMLHRNLKDLEDIEELFNARYFGAARKSIILALRTCSEKFRSIHVGTPDDFIE